MAIIVESSAFPTHHPLLVVLSFHRIGKGLNHTDSLLREFQECFVISGEPSMSIKP